MTLVSETRALSEKPTSGFPLTLSFSWHNNLTATQLSVSQQRLIPYGANDRNDIKYMDEAEVSPAHYPTTYHNTSARCTNQIENGYANSSVFRPKRSRSISSNVRDSVHPKVASSMSTYNLNNHHSVSAGFRTPQSNTNFKCKQALDAKFLALASSGLDSTMESSAIANSDFLFRRLETIGSGSYATVYKTQHRYVLSVGTDCSNITRVMRQRANTSISQK